MYSIEEFITNNPDFKERYPNTYIFAIYCEEYIYSRGWNVPVYLNWGETVKEVIVGIKRPDIIPNQIWIEYSERWIETVGVRVMVKRFPSDMNDLYHKLRELAFCKNSP